MSNAAPLIIDKKDKVNGLYTYCGKCKRLIENRMCSVTGKRLSTCKNTDQHGFKAIISIPGTDSKKRKTRIFNTRNFNEAIRLKLEFEEELQANDYQSTDIHIETAISKPDLLIECMAMYIGYLNNEGVAIHKAKIRTKSHIKETEYYFELFCKCLLFNGIYHTILRIDKVNDRIVSLFHAYLLNEKRYANKTYNKIIALFRQFFNWLITNNDYNIKNPFIEVVRRLETTHCTTINFEEFNSLLDSINLENSYKELSTGERKNQYRPWLANAFKLALETGLRREEFMNLKFSDINCNDSDQPKFIVVENFKVNRIKGIEEGQGKKKHIPVTLGLLQLLNEMEFNNFKGTDRYLIANDEIAHRQTLIGFVSKAFSGLFYFDVLEIKLDSYRTLI